MEKQVKPSYAFGPFHLDSAKRQLLREGAVVSLTPKVFETLLYLVENCDRVVEKEELIDWLWPDSFVEEGERLRVTVQLVRVSDGTSLWGETFDERFTGIFTLQDSLSDKVAQKMLLKLSGEEKRQLTKRYTHSTDAYQAYVVGRYHWNKRTEEGLRTAVKYYNEAIERNNR